MRIVLLFSFAFLACSPSTPTPDDASTDGASSLDAISESSSPNDSSASDVSVADATNDSPADANDGGACVLEATDGGTCNAMTSLGSNITATCPTGAAPTAAGGTIYNGRYVLTQVQYFGVTGTCTNTAAGKTDWLICGDQWETIDSPQQGAPYNYNFTANVQSPNVTLTQSCGGNVVAPWSYDATPTSITFHIPQGNNETRVDTFALQ